RVRYQAALHPEDRTFTLGFPFQQSQDLLQLVAHPGEDPIAFRTLDRLRLRKLFAGTRYGESTLVEQRLDLQNLFHIRFPVHAMTGLALLRGEVGELRLPEPQNVGFQSRQLTYLP